jgi:hypothetical protein
MSRPYTRGPMAVRCLKSALPAVREEDTELIHTSCPIQLTCSQLPCPQTREKNTRKISYKIILIKKINIK